MVREKLESSAPELNEHPYNSPGWWPRGEEYGLFRSSTHAGERAPDFTLPLLDGGELTLSSLRGKPVVMEFGNIT